MRRALLATVFAALSSLAHAQTVPHLARSGFSTGTIPPANDPVSTEADVEAAIGTKQDVNGDVSGQHVLVPGGFVPKALTEMFGYFPSIGALLVAGQTADQLTSGTIDAQPVLSAALALGPLRLPCGTYRLDRPLSFTSTSKLYLDGASPGCVTLNANYASGDVFSLVGTQRARVRDITVNAVVPHASGSVFHLQGSTYDAQFEGVTISGPFSADGWLIDGANTTHISHYDCRPPVAFVVGTFGARACVHATGNFADIHLSHGNSASWNYGVEVTNGSGMVAESIDAVLSGNGVIFDPGAGQSVFGIEMSNILADTSAGDNWLFAGAGIISDVQITNSWASNSQGATGMAFTAPATDGVMISNSTILSNGSNGIALLNGINISFSNDHVCMNARSSALGVADGIQIGPAVDHVTIMGSESGLCGLLSRQGKTNTQRWGINVIGGSTGGQTVMLIGNMTWANTTGGTHIVAGAVDAFTSIGNVGN